VPIDAEYVLPLRWSAETSRREVAGLAAYLTWLLGIVDVTVVDGSEPAVFERHAQLWPRDVRHLRPGPWPGRNGKVAGVVTGVRAARHERVVVADDDVRYTAATLEAVVAGLGRADLVRPPNVFSALPWHARWDTGRSLLNRAFGHDHPGTHGIRRSVFLAMGGYDGDVLFENLELARTVEAFGGAVLDLPSVFVPRLPPTMTHFWSQRVRQAYDDLAQPGRLAAELVVLPGAVVLARRSPRTLRLLALGVVVAAEAGRRRAGGAQAYPALAALWALPWLAERSVCVWLALGERARGGVRYAGTRLPRAATPWRVLRRRFREPLTPTHLGAP
jgi:hypothetical protein